MSGTEKIRPAFFVMSSFLEWLIIERMNGLISDALPFGRLWYGGPNAVNNAIGYALHRSRSHQAVNRVYDQTANERMRILPEAHATGAVPEWGETLALV